MSVDDSTPLIAAERPRKTRWATFSPASRVLVAGFLISVALNFTQVPILYVFRVMECDEFYLQHPSLSDPSGLERCNRPEIDSGTAAQVSLLGLSTLFCGTLNLFLAGWQIRTWGPRLALVSQTFFPVLRVALQVVGVTVGARTGIIIIQLSQLIGLLGGVTGYLLVLNTAAGEVVAPIQRMAIFGKLQGSVMLGTAVGYLLGGISGDKFGIRRPFEISTIMFAVSCAYAAIFVPYIDPKTLSDGDKLGSKGLAGFFGPAKLVMPTKIRLGDGRIKKHYGVTFLAVGIFLGVLATGYAPFLIQMYATAAFGFGTAENGYLMAVNSLIRGVFLMLGFPRLISLGRKWYAKSAAVAPLEVDSRLPTAPGDFDPPAGILAGEEPAKPPAPVDEDAGRGFDLFFLRWSLVADGLVTAITAFATQGWHIYIAGFLLPLASGSAPASKGVVTEMVPRSQRAAALQMMTLVENIAMMSTLGVFGYIFTAFSDMGKAYLTFFCNAAVAMVAVLVLLFSQFPPRDSEPETAAAPQDTEGEVTRT